MTLEDVLEELIGDFDDESDRRLGECEQLPDGSYQMSGSTRVEHFEGFTGVELPEGDWQTVAGYVIDAFDDIPSEGERVLTDIGEFEVLKMDGFAIDALRIRMTVPGNRSD